MSLHTTSIYEMMKSLGEIEDSYRSVAECVRDIHYSMADTHAEVVGRYVDGIDLPGSSILKPVQIRLIAESTLAMNTLKQQILIENDAKIKVVQRLAKSVADGPTDTDFPERFQPSIN